MDDLFAKKISQEERDTNINLKPVIYQRLVYWF